MNLKNSKVKILVVFTGGTISCSEEGGVLSPDDANSRTLIGAYQRRYGGAEFISVKPYTILSENLCAENLNALFDCIKGCGLVGYDGVIVTHGTDTIQYSAAFLAYKLGLCEVPVVLVSANYPLADPRSNGLENFAAAVDFIRAGQGKGVFAAYRNSGENGVRVHRATKLLPQLPFSDKLYSALNDDYGIVENRVFRKNPSFRDDDFSEDCSDLRLNGTVLFLKQYVGMRYPPLSPDIKAVLLEGYHSGTLNTASSDLKRFCLAAREIEVPVYLAGACDGFPYESKLAFEQMGIRVLPPVSPIAAYIKLWLK